VTSTTLRAVEEPPSAIEQNLTLSSQSDTGCQPVVSTTLSAVEPPPHAAGGVPEHIAKKRKASMARRLELEVEHARNTSGHLGFSNWLRIHRPEQWAKIQSQNLALKHAKTAAAHPTRSPP
jgi:hypothetical protein